MKTATAYSTKKPVADAVGEVKRGCASVDPKMVVFFASTAYDPASLSKAMADAFPKASVFGCSTAGEIVTGKMLKESVVAMAYSSEVVGDVAVGVMEGIKDDKGAEGVSKVFRDFERHYGAKMADLDFSRYVGIILVDGMSVAEERLMDKIGDLTNVLFVGGSAGDDLQFARTYVYANGKAYTDAAILTLLKPAKGFDIVKTQSFGPLASVLLQRR